MHFVCVRQDLRAKNKKSLCDLNNILLQIPQHHFCIFLFSHKLQQQQQTIKTSSLPVWKAYYIRHFDAFVSNRCRYQDDCWPQQRWLVAGLEDGRHQQVTRHHPSLDVAPLAFREANLLPFLILWLNLFN